MVDAGRLQARCLALKGEAVLKRLRAEVSPPVGGQPLEKFSLLRSCTPLKPTSRLDVFSRAAARLSGVLGLLMVLAGGTARASEADLVLPDFRTVSFLGGINGHSLLMAGILVSLFGLVFGFMQYTALRNLPVHKSMLEISELIYETCKTYLITQGKFILILEVLIGAVMVVYFGVAAAHGAASRSSPSWSSASIGIAGSYGVAWFGIRVNTFANSRTAFASLRGKPYPTYAIPLQAGMSIGMVLISIELLLMLIILLFVPPDFAGPCFIGFAIGESLGASRAAHRGRHLHEDRRHRLGPDEDRLQDQGRRRAQPGRHRRLHG